MTLTAQLIWCPHYGAIIESQAFHTGGTFLIKLIYNALIQPRFDYCAPVWDVKFLSMSETTKIAKPSSKGYSASQLRGKLKPCSRKH